jgi:hypothetical protein
MITKSLKDPEVSSRLNSLLQMTTQTIWQTPGEFFTEHPTYLPQTKVKKRP